MEKRMTEQEFRSLYHRMIEGTLSPQSRMDSAWEIISSTLWGGAEKKGCGRNVGIPGE